MQEACRSGKSTPSPDKAVTLGVQPDALQHDRQGGRIYGEKRTVRKTRTVARRWIICLPAHSSTSEPSGRIIESPQQSLRPMSHRSCVFLSLDIGPNYAASAMRWTGRVHPDRVIVQLQNQRRRTCLAGGSKVPLCDRRLPCGPAGTISANPASVPCEYKSFQEARRRLPHHFRRLRCHRHLRQAAPEVQWNRLVWGLSTQARDRRGSP